MDPLDVYVLGAGASYVHGAPLTDGLLPYALMIEEHRNDHRVKLIRQFLADVFHFHAPDRRRDKGWQAAPGLVDVLSMVDMALDHKDSLARAYDVEKLRHIRRALEFAIFVALEDSLSGRGRQRGRQPTKRLVGKLDPSRTAILSLNYDITVDVALARHCAGQKRLPSVSYEHMSEGSGVDALRRYLDYGVEFANVRAAPRPGRIRLLKLHGSLNWLRSRVTGDLYYGGLRKAVGMLYRGAEGEAVGSLYSLYNERSRDATTKVEEAVDDFEPILVTPTHLKDLRNPHLARIWRLAESTLRRAWRITFIGYSLPGDDLHVKFLLKRALETRARDAKPPEIVVVEKGRVRDNPVRSNYERFFGKDLVRFHGCGFDTWLDRHFRPRRRPH